METTRRACPTCGRMLTEADGCFTCADHGDWYSYSPKLLVRTPSAAALMTERVLMPWEQDLSISERKHRAVAAERPRLSGDPIERGALADGQHGIPAIILAET